LDRCALFVDANYALAEGALVVHGTRNRDSVSWDYAGLLKLLSSLSRDRTGLPLLRCYWYDTAADGARAAEHETLADIPAVKLRLSKARPSRKEGVEAEIRKDLTALARNRAVSDVIIVSAEEDLAPVIAEVQDLGIRTVLFHIATDGGWAIARTLRQECDDIIEIGGAHLQPYADLISGAEPQLPTAGFRELAGASAQASGPHPAIEAPPVRLYGSPLTSEYEHAALAGAGQVHGHRQDAPRFGGPAEMLHSGPILGTGDSQPGLGGAPHTQGPGPSQAQPMAHPQAAQAPMTQPAHAQMAPGQLAQPSVGSPPGYLPQAQQSPGVHQDPGQPLGASPQSPQYQQSEATRSQRPVGAEAGYDQARFGAPESRGPVGQHRHEQGVGFDQRSADDGRSLGQPGHPGSNGAGQIPLGQNGPSQNGLGRDQLGQQFSQAQFGLPQPPQGQFGQVHPSHPGQVNGPGLGGNGVGNQLPGGFGAQGGVPPSGGGGQPSGQPGIGLPPGRLPANGMPAAPGGQGNGLPPRGFQGHGLPPNPAPPNTPPSGLSANGAPNGMSSGPGVTPGQARRDAGGPGSTGSAMPPATMPPDGRETVDGQRAALPQRQLPPANGMPYAQDRSMPYSGSGQPAQFSGPVATSAYRQDGYVGQGAVAPVAMSVGDAVQSAHAEGFGFGEAVARDAPALWLEAVLARKPRMPSDLEARLLQGSALPIDSLLHDEVRHALRRGFWDALERSRR
jgi:hypothetical protein